MIRYIFRAYFRKIKHSGIRRIVKSVLFWKKVFLDLNQKCQKHLWVRGIRPSLDFFIIFWIFHIFWNIFITYFAHNKVYVINSERWSGKQIQITLSTFPRFLSRITWVEFSRNIFTLTKKHYWYLIERNISQIVLDFSIY